MRVHLARQYHELAEMTAMIDNQYLANVYETSRCVVDITTGEVFERDDEEAVDADADERRA